MMKPNRAKQQLKPSQRPLLEMVIDFNETSLKGRYLQCLQLALDKEKALQRLITQYKEQVIDKKNDTFTNKLLRTTFDTLYEQQDPFATLEDILDQCSDHPIVNYLRSANPADALYKQVFRMVCTTVVLGTFSAKAYHLMNVRLKKIQSGDTSFPEAQAHNCEKDLLTHRQQVLLLHILGALDNEPIDSLTKDGKGILFGALLNKNKDNTANFIQYGRHKGKSHFNVWNDSSVDAVEKVLKEAGLKYTRHNGKIVLEKLQKS